jgi:hypothetical protein
MYVERSMKKQFVQNVIKIYSYDQKKGECMPLYISIPAVLIAMVLMIFGSIKYEKWRYNDGICRKCGAELRYFDRDSQGRNGYTCDACDYTVWISWLGIVAK